MCEKPGGSNMQYYLKKIFCGIDWIGVSREEMEEE